MTKQEKTLFTPFDCDKDDKYLLRFANGDSFIVEIDGQGESELHPITGDDVDTYWGYVFHILEVLSNVTDNYCVDALIEISKYFYPELIANVTDWSVLRRTKTDICEKCGGIIYYINDYPSYSIVCMDCGYGVASTEFLPIENDESEYSLVINKTQKYTNEQLSIIKKLTGMSYLYITNNYHEGFVIMQGKATKLFPIKYKLSKANVEVVINPDMDYPEEDIMFISIKNYLN